jgi:hypothetical protein
MDAVFTGPGRTPGGASATFTGGGGSGGLSATQRAELSALIARYAPDEVILTGQIHDHAARVRSFEIAAGVMQDMAAPQRRSA